MAEEKKKVDYFPDLEYRFYPIVFKEQEMEGIQGPVYRPSGEVMHLENSEIVGMEAPTEVFHDGDAKVYELSNTAVDLENVRDDIVYGYVPCPGCESQIPIRSEDRPLKIKCPNCGKKGKLE